MKKRKINYHISKKYRNIKDIIEKRYMILICLIVFSFFIILSNLFYIQIIKNDYYKSKVAELSVKTVSGTTAPRGRIYDRNYRIIVDNKPVKTVTYKKESETTIKEEIEIAYKLKDMLDIDASNLSKYNLKKFFLVNNNEVCVKKVTEEELQLYRERKITLEEIEKLKLERITDEELKNYTDEDKKAAYIYYLMNNGYYFDQKVIKAQNVTDFEYAKISENLSELKGVNVSINWERYYTYGNVFRSVLGSVSKNTIPAELKDYYLEKGYKLDDKVGTSYLEFQYEDLLRGQKNIYEIKDNKEYLISEGIRGNDIVLTIDIELQKAVEEIITNQLIEAKKEKNTEFLDSSFVVIANPNNGEILAMAGKQISLEEENYEVYDFTPGVITTSVVAGSVVKGASNIVAYNNGALTIGEKRDDYCVKVAATPEKCSWKYLGLLDDITALKFSSNSFQYQSAIKIGGGVYEYNKPLSLNENAFDIYRNGFAEFGLGIKTGIDLPFESTGYKGSSTKSGHLLDFAIGQYDTYTPIQLSQYVNTIANGGYRIKPHLLKSVYSSENSDLEELIYTINPEILNKVNTEDKYIKRVQDGFKAVLESGGTGYGHIQGAIGAGKTGTSEGYIDTDNDGLVDTMTYNNNFIGYAPYDAPIVSFAVVSPNTYHKENNISYRTKVNYRISQEVSKKFFEIMK